MFIKVKDREYGHSDDVLINTERIDKIRKEGDNYLLVFSRVNVEVDKEDAQKIFKAIGVSL